MPKAFACDADIEGMSVIEVAVAVIFASDGRSVLVSQRAQDAHLGGTWEFPGGKLEPGESPYQALQREVSEELGIEVLSATAILVLPYHYPEKEVLLHVFSVNQYRGHARSLENQPLRWVELAALRSEQFPAANLPIIRWLQLPEYYLITPDPGPDHQAYLQSLQQAMRQRPCLLQFRAPCLSREAYHELAQQLLAVCQTEQRLMLVNCSVEQFETLPAAGLHLSAQRARQFQSRPIAADRLLACSCHNEAELQQAVRLGADLVVLSLVQPSPSHPGAPVLGWDGFASLSAARPYPVYALGGLHLEDVARAQALGGKGIAAIRAFL